MNNSTTVPIRFAVLTAVSTKAQAADDKVSLGEQLDACRERGSRRGWLETAGPYIIPGQSRTRYVDLSKAEGDIPALREMLNVARSGKFDVLVIFEYNRLRDLLDLVSIVLSGYGIQIFSATQPVEPMPPDEFKPYLASTQDIMQSMSKVISKRQADDLRIKYETGMSGRVTKLGLPARIPYAYKKPVGREWDPKAVPVQDPDLVPIVIHMKDMLLAGQSIRQIRNWLDENKISSPGGNGQWYPNVIRGTLLNPFYAGQVRWGISRIVFDARERKAKTNRAIPADQIITASGAHKPLWDNATYQSICAELKRRGRSYRGMSANQLTGLLRCGVCGATMRIYRSGFWKSPLGRQAYLRCAVGSSEHMSIRFIKAVEMVAEELVKCIQHDPSENDEKAGKLAELQTKIDDLTARRKRLIDAYEVGMLELSEYGQRRKLIDAKLGDLEQQKRDSTTDTYTLDERRSTLEFLRKNLATLRAYVIEGDKQEVNHTLRLILDHATVYKTGKQKNIELTFK